MDTNRLPCERFVILIRACTPVFLVCKKVAKNKRQSLNSNYQTHQILNHGLSLPAGKRQVWTQLGLPLHGKMMEGQATIGTHLVFGQ